MFIEIGLTISETRAIAQVEKGRFRGDAKLHMQLDLFLSCHHHNFLCFGCAPFLLIRGQVRTMTEMYTCVYVYVSVCMCQKTPSSQSKIFFKWPQNSYQSISSK